MAQIFPRSFNAVSKLSILALLFLAVAGGAALMEMNMSSYVTRVNVPLEQPVPFSHSHHVGDIGIDCRYCHTSVENGAFAGIPPTKTCMNCHSILFNDAPMLEPVRESFKTGKPLEWTRVHDLPDFVFFNHSIHVAKGVGCTTCHGQIDKMPLTWKANTLHMSWCLECHRHPEKFVRPKEEVFNVHWETPSNQEELGAQLVKEYKINRNTDCVVCHR